MGKPFHRFIQLVYWRTGRIFTAGYDYTRPGTEWNTPLLPGKWCYPLYSKSWYCGTRVVSYRRQGTYGRAFRKWGYFWNCRVTWEIISTGYPALEFAKRCGCYTRVKQSRPYKRKYRNIWFWTDRRRNGLNQCPWPKRKARLVLRKWFLYAALFAAVKFLLSKSRTHRCRADNTQIFIAVIGSFYLHIYDDSIWWSFTKIVVSLHIFSTKYGDT